jgi:hypothetical protein
VQILRDPGWLGKWVGSLILCAGLVTMFVFRRPSAAGTASIGVSSAAPKKTSDDLAPVS